MRAFETMPRFLLRILALLLLIPWLIADPVTSPVFKITAPGIIYISPQPTNQDLFETEALATTPIGQLHQILRHSPYLITLLFAAAPALGFVDVVPRSLPSIEQK